MFKPKYTISHKLLENIKQITLLVYQLNRYKFPKVILAELEKEAQIVSSFASTSIEGNPLPLASVRKVLKNTPSNINNSQLEILNYNKALKKISHKLNQKTLTLELILSVHKIVTENLLPTFGSGQLRKKPVVANNPKTAQIVFIPPNCDQVEPLMNDLIIFINSNQKKIDPLILASIFHKQIAIIHPFMDGNGRTARLITKFLLAKMGLDTFNLFSFENYYNKNVGKYFQLVGEYGDYYEIKDKIDFTMWLEYFTDGIIEELARVKALLPSFFSLNNLAADPQAQLKPHHQKILKYLSQNNFITDRDYAKLTKRAKATRALDFQKLLKSGLIKRKGKGKNTYYIILQKIKN